MVPKNPGGLFAHCGEGELNQGFQPPEVYRGLKFRRNAGELNHEMDDEHL